MLKIADVTLDPSEVLYLSVPTKDKEGKNALIING